MQWSYYNAKVGISIHAPREGRDGLGSCDDCAARKISIHAPREGRDAAAKRAAHERFISIHAPREGRDFVLQQNGEAKKLFQSTRPARGATAKVNKFLRTFLQKSHGFQIFLRKTLPFKALCRLQIGKNFSICGANRCGNFCELVLRTIRSSVPRADTSACSRSVRFYSRTSCPSSKIEGCPFLGQ